MSYTFNPFTGNLDVTPFSLDGAGKIPSDYLPIGSGGEVELNLGSAGSPSLFFNGDANTGLYSPGADQVAISTSGTGRLFVDASGQVGIGAAPLSGHQFTVNGSNLARICLQTAALGQTTADGFSLETDSSATYFTNRENTPSIFYTNNTERLRIDSSGRLLVGTPSNSGGALLQVNDNRIRIATAKTPHRHPTLAPPERFAGMLITFTFALPPIHGSAPQSAHGDDMPRASSVQHLQGAQTAD